MIKHSPIKGLPAGRQGEIFVENGYICFITSSVAAE